MTARHPRHRRSRLRSRSTQAAVILLAAVAAILGLSTLGGYSSVAFTSGSMAPAIDEGALAITRSIDASEVAPGDVVSVTTADGERVTHRVVGVEELPWITSLTLRGDANASADPMPYLVESADEVVLAIPYVGRWSGAGLPVLAGLGLLVVAGVARGRLRGPRHRAPAGPTAARSGASILTALGLVGVAVFGAAPTSAYWTDTGRAGTGGFSTVATIPAPSYVGCAVHDNHVDGTWTNAGQRYDYRATLHTLAGSQVGSSSTPPYAGALNSVAQLTRHLTVSDFGITPADLGFPGQFNFNIRVHAQAYGSTATAARWSSTGYAVIPVHFESVSGSTYQMRCGHDLDTYVEITAVGQDTGSSATDLITRIAANTVIGTGEPGSTISVRRGGVQIGTATVAANGTWSAAVALTEGSAEITAIATDIHGHTAQDSADVVLDTIAPTVTPTSACATANIGNVVSAAPTLRWCKQTSQSWTATYVDNAGGSGLVAGTGRQYDNNGAGWTNYTAAVSMAEANGRVMQARGTDVAGNVTTVANTYYIDGTAPTLTVTQPAGSSLLAATLRANVTAACGSGKAGCGPFVDAISGPVSAQWKLLRSQALAADVCMNAAGSFSAANCSTTYPAAVSGGQWSIAVAPGTAYPFLTLVASYTLTISAVTDAAGNVAPSVTRTFSTLL